MKFSLDKICKYFELKIYFSTKGEYITTLLRENNMAGDSRYIGRANTVEDAITEALFSADLKPRDYYEDGHESDD